MDLLLCCITLIAHIFDLSARTQSSFYAANFIQLLQLFLYNLVFKDYLLKAFNGYSKVLHDLLVNDLHFMDLGADLFRLVLRCGDLPPHQHQFVAIFFDLDRLLLKHIKRLALLPLVVKDCISNLPLESLDPMYGLLH